MVFTILLCYYGLYVQGFHLHLRKCMDAPCVSPEIADAVILEFISQWNQNVEEKHMGAPHYGLASLQLLDECVVRFRSEFVVYVKLAYILLGMPPSELISDPLLPGLNYFSGRQGFTSFVP
jgi:hypothetical protein